MRRSRTGPSDAGAPGGERLQKALAHAGVASRRHAEQLITAGRVQVNGQVVTTLGARVEPTDVVTVDGRAISAPEALRYYVTYKPVGVVTTVSDPEGRPTVLGLVPSGERVYPVGRLDADSEGLLLLTNDGELANRLIRPRFGVEKEYHVFVVGDPSDATLSHLSEGVMLDDGFTAPARVRRLRVHSDGTWLSITLHEGRKRQIRRMCGAVGHPVRRIVRVRIGPIRLDQLEPGAARELTGAELSSLRREAGLA